MVHADMHATQIDMQRTRLKCIISTLDKKPRSFNGFEKCILPVTQGVLTMWELQ